MIVGTWSLVTAPAVEPISVAEAREHLLMSSSSQDTKLARVIKTARSMCESATERRLITQTWDWMLDAFPCGARLEIPHPTLQSVTSITYVDSAGATQTFDAAKYIVTAPSGERAARGDVELAYEQEWPVTRSQRNAVTVRVVLGYGTAGSDVPAPLIDGMLLVLGELWNNREESVIGVSTTPGVLRARDLWYPFGSYGVNA